MYYNTTSCTDCFIVGTVHKFITHKEMAAAKLEYRYAPLTAIYSVHLLKSEVLFIVLDKGEWSVGFLPLPIYEPRSTRWIQGLVGSRAGVDPVEIKISAPCCLSTSDWRRAHGLLSVA